MLLNVKELTKTYGTGAQQVCALKKISFSVQKGEFVTIMGPSGSGKSTLLHLIGTLDQPSSGEVWFEQHEISHRSDEKRALFRRRSLGFVFQFFNLLPHLTAIENVLLPIVLDRKSYRGYFLQAKKWLQKFGLEERIHHFPEALSGGELQRVAICRALLTKPLLILADEPTGNLDSKNGKQVLKWLQRLVYEEKQTLLMVTHDEQAASYGTRVLHLRDGALVFDGKPQEAKQWFQAQKEKEKALLC